MKKNNIYRLVLLVLVSCLGLSAMAQTAMERLKKDYPAVMEQYGKNLQDLKTHYIFVVDVSGTMDKYKDEVVIPGIKTFLETLPKGDQASIIAFGGRAEESCTPLKINAENKKLLIAALNESYTRKAQLDAGATGHTFLDVAAAKLLDVVEKDTVSDICFAVFFSDLCDERPSEWNYKERVSKLEGRAFGVVATALSAVNENQKQRGIRRMENTFEGFSYSSNVKDVFGEKLENFKYAIFVPELKRIVVEELGKVLEGLNLNVKLHLNKQVKLHADFNKNTPAFIKGISVDTVWLTDQSPAISSVKFVASPKIPRFKKSCRIGRLVFAEKGKLFHHEPYLSAGLIYHLDTPEPKTDKDPSFERDLVNLDIVEALSDESFMDAKAVWVVGWPFGLFCVVAAAIIIYVILLVVNTIVPHTAKKKKLAVKDPLTNNTQYHQLMAKRTFTIGNGNCDCKIPGALFRIKATYRNGSPLNLLWKRRLVLVLDSKQSNGVQMSQGSRNNLAKASIRKGKKATITQNIAARYEMTLS